MRKMMALVLSAAMALSLTACGGQSGEKPADTKAAGSSTAASEASGSGDSASVDTAGVAAPGSPERYSVGGGSAGGNFYIVGGGVATVVNNLLPDYFVMTAEETGGGTANLTMLQNGDVEFGVTMTSCIDEAMNGTAEWTNGKPLDKIRGMLPLYPSYLTIYALKSSNLNTLQDLNGKIVGFGSKGAAMDSVYREAFPAMGVNPKDIFNDGHSATATAVGDGQVDAALLYSLPPFAAITELEATKELTFIGLTEEEQNYLTSTYSFMKAGNMPAGSYQGVTEDLPVVIEWNVLCTSSDVPEDYVYLITKTLMENNPPLVEVYKGLTNVTPENTLNFNCPLHAGVVRYLEEVGIEVPQELIPAEYQG